MHFVLYVAALTILVWILIIVEVYNYSGKVCYVWVVVGKLHPIKPQ